MEVTCGVYEFHFSDCSLVGGDYDISELDKRYDHYFGYVEVAWGLIPDGQAVIE